MRENNFDPDASNWYVLSFILVHPNLRSRGVGRALVQECLSRAIDLIAEGVLLELFVPNHAAKSLYESFGFETWSEITRAYQYKGTQFYQASMRKVFRRD